MGASCSFLIDAYFILKLLLIVEVADVLGVDEDYIFFSDSELVEV